MNDKKLIRGKNYIFITHEEGKNITLCMGEFIAETPDGLICLNTAEIKSDTKRVKKSFDTFKDAVLFAKNTLHLIYDNKEMFVQ